MPAPVTTRLDDILPRYDAVLLDAYGVLVDGGGALPGAHELIATLRARRQPFAVVTNDASRLPATVAARLASLGLDVDVELVITSGSLIGPHLRDRGLIGGRCAVLGTADSRRYVEDGGGIVVELPTIGRIAGGAVDRPGPLTAATPGFAIDALIVCDDAGYPFLDGLDAALSACIRTLDGGGEVALILPNPDSVYPKGAGHFGFTAGAAALLIETALRRRYPGRKLGFAHLGKPNAAMFLEGQRRLGGGRVLMVGDQLETDIAGALAAGLDAALVGAGVSRWHDDARHPVIPTWLIPSLT